MDPHGAQQDLLIGQTIGNYLVTQKLGEGGMGAVYLAEHPAIGKKVALKVLHSEFSSNQEVAARFFNEAKAVNDIGHPNIVDIVDFGIIQAGMGREQLVYFIMEYLAGTTLSGLIRNESPLPPERALSIGLQVADALAASHRCGIVHRDLKPDNIILIDRHRERDFVKLLDFGIAKLTGDAVGSSRTRTGIVMGTPAYMSPEQCEGRGSIDHRTDIYALGIVLYEMMTGRVPFIGEGYGEILVQHLTQTPIPPSQFRMMNAHVEAVVMKALEKRPDMRYPTMDEMMRAMADPVGYVESHGGIPGFSQRQLMPSTGPLPPIRMTPAPLTMTTPAPGQVMMTPYGLQATPVPTTLGAAAGQQMMAPRSKMPLIVAAIVVIAAAAIAVAAVVSAKKKDGQVAANPGSEIASNQAGSDTTPDLGSAHTVVRDSGSAVESGSSEGSATITPPPPPPKKTTAKITFKTQPDGAQIYFNGILRDDITTATQFELPISATPLKVTLRKDGYEDIELKDFVVSDDFTQQFPAFKRKRVSTPHTNTNTNKGSGKGSGKGSSTTSPTNDTGLIRPD